MTAIPGLLSLCAVIEAVDLDAALSIARSFPMPDGKIEVRPVVER